MKRKTLLTILFLSAVTITKIAAIPVITVSYVNDCWIGCGEVVKDKVLTNGMLPDGGYYTYWAMSITCRGLGLRGCPKEVNTAKGELDLEPSQVGWVETNSLDMWQYANEQIDAGNNSGNHTIQVHNIDLNRTFTFVVTWNKWEDENKHQQEAITVTMEPGEIILPSTEGE